MSKIFRNILLMAVLALLALPVAASGPECCCGSEGEGLSHGCCRNDELACTCDVSNENDNSAIVNKTDTSGGEAVGHAIIHFYDMDFSGAKVFASPRLAFKEGVLLKMICVFLC